MISGIGSGNYGAGYMQSSAIAEGPWTGGNVQTDRYGRQRGDFSV